MILKFHMVPKIELFDDGLMGGKAIQLVFDPTMTAQKAHHSGDTIPSQLGDGLLALGFQPT